MIVPSGGSDPPAVAVALTVRQSAMKAATPALVALARAGTEHRVHEYEHDPSVRSFGQEAAGALRVDPTRVFKTLITAWDRELGVCVVPVAATLDLKAAAAAVGTKRVEMADPARAERTTGYLLGAISPLGQKRALLTVIDDSAFDHDTVFCSAGRRGLEIEIAPDDLLALTSGRRASIAKHA